MNSLLWHWALYAGSLAIGGVVLALTLRHPRRDPVVAYRVLVWALWIAMLLPAGQLFVHGRGGSWIGPLEGWHVSEAPTAPSSRAAVAPRDLHASSGVSTRDSTSGEIGLPLPRESGSRPFAVAWLCIYGGGVLLLALREAVRHRARQRLIHGARPVSSEPALRLWRELSKDSRTLARCRLLETEDVVSPACWGLLRPVILLPTHHFESDSLRWALRHEAQHLLRGDPLTAALQSGLRTLVWFHPFVWWLSSRLDRFRELSCDALVVESTGQPRSYALALLAFSTPRHGKHAFAEGALHATNHAASMQERIHMLARHRPERRGFRSLVLPAALLAAGCWAHLGLAAGIAPQEKPAASPDETRLIVDVLPLDDPSLDTERLPIRFRGQQPKDLKELRGWIFREADPRNHPSKTFADGSPVPPLRTADNKPVYPSDRILRIRCSRRQVFGWVQCLLQICTFVPGNNYADELQDSPLVYRVEMEVLEDGRWVRSDLPVDRGIGGPMPPNEAEILFKVLKAQWRAPVGKREVVVSDASVNVPWGKFVGLPPQGPLGVRLKPLATPRDLPATIDAWLKKVHEKEPRPLLKLNAYARTPFLYVFDVLESARRQGFDGPSFSGIPGSLMRDLEARVLK